MSLSFKIASRFLKSNRGQTILIVLGIAIGVSVQIFIGSLIQGLQKSLVEKTIGNSPQITIVSTAEDKKIYDYDLLLEDIKMADNNIEKISIASDVGAIMKFMGNSQSILIRGLNLEDADRIYNIKNRIVEGRIPETLDEVILGFDLKSEYGISVNDVIEIVTQKGEVVKCKVVGFYDLKVASINKSWAITTLETVQKTFNIGESITSIEIQLTPTSVFQADEIGGKIDRLIIKESIKVENWKEQNEQLLSGLQGQSVSSIMIQVFVIISVVLGIASVLAITVLQKSRQIGILKAMGIKNSAASKIFLYEGLILGVFGAIVGIILGLGLSFTFTKFALNPDGTPVVELYISYSFIGISGLIAVTSSVIAALIPAIRSSKLNPIDIIRNN